MRSGNWLKPRDSGIRGHTQRTSPATCSSSGQPFTPMVSSKSAHSITSSPVSMYSHATRRVSRMPSCGAMSTM